MQCRDAQFYLRLRRHAADELGTDVTAALDGHLATCAACCRRCAGFRVVRPRRRVRDDGRSGPVRAARAADHASGPRRRARRLRNKAFRVGGLVAAALLIVGIGFSLIDEDATEGDTATTSFRKSDEYVRESRKATPGSGWPTEKLPERLTRWKLRLQPPGPLRSRAHRRPVRAGDWCSAPGTAAGSRRSTCSARAASSTPRRCRTPRRRTSAPRS